MINYDKIKLMYISTGSGDIHIARMKRKPSTFNEKLELRVVSVNWHKGIFPFLMLSILLLTF